MNDGGKEVPFALRQSHANMDLRDCFAAVALQGMLSSDKTIDAVARLAKSGGEAPEEYIASMAYGYASAMLHWKEKRE